jgi:ribulose-phosphate 3-epimerase
MGPIVLRSISPIVHDGGGRLDCHLMVEEPQRHFAAVAEAGGDSVTFHYEAVSDVAAVVRAAREQELQVGLAFKPETSPEAAAEAAESVDLVLCMSIEPGYSGQPFMPEAIPRIARLRELLPPEQHIQVDGGIGAENAREVRAAGATLLVAGTSIFGREDLTRAYRRLVEAVA